MVVATKNIAEHDQHAADARLGAVPHRDHDQHAAKFSVKFRQREDEKQKGENQ